MYAAYVLDREDYARAARRGANWLLQRQRREGSLAIAYNRSLREMGRRALEIIFPRRVSDATAQAIRIWQYFHCTEGGDHWLQASRRAAQFLEQLQVAEGRPEMRGALQYWPGHPVLFAWPTLFASEAFHYVSDGAAGTSAEGWISEIF